MSEHRARKRFGQNFLHDQGIIQRIARAIKPEADQTLVEIGPGQAALTRPILESGCQLHVIELDRDLIPGLQTLQAMYPNLTIHEGDALKFSFSDFSDTKTLRVVGNLPYNISTPLIFHLLEQADSIIDMHFMLQKEVVERMAAPPGNKTYGRLSVSVQARADVSNLFTVGPGAFNPPPKVDSAIVRIKPRPAPFHVEDWQQFDRLVSMSFAQRRKTLGKSLKTELSPAQFAAAEIDPVRRPETLHPHEFAALANQLSHADGSNN